MTRWGETLRQWCVPLAQQHALVLQRMGLRRLAHRGLSSVAVIWAGVLRKI